MTGTERTPEPESSFHLPRMAPSAGRSASRRTMRTGRWRPRLSRRETSAPVAGSRIKCDLLRCSMIHTPEASVELLCAATVTNQTRSAGNVSASESEPNRTVRLPPLRTIAHHVAGRFRHISPTQGDASAADTVHGEVARRRECAVRCRWIARICRPGQRSGRLAHQNRRRWRFDKDADLAGCGNRILKWRIGQCNDLIGLPAVARCRVLSRQ